MARPRNLLLMLLVVVCGASLWLGRGQPLPKILSRNADPPQEVEAPPLTKAEEPVHLRILNGTEQPGLAADFALLLPRLGFVVEGIGNAPAWPGGPSVLINRRLAPAMAGELAASLGGIPVLKEWDGRTTEDAVLVLGDDFPAIRDLLKTVQR
jgi:hypothetical protein